MAKQINPERARKVVSLYGSGTEVRLNLLVTDIKEEENEKSSLAKTLVNLLRAGRIPKRAVSSRKIEGFIVCPVCGNHKKLNKAPLDGSGSRVRQIKINRNKYAQIVAKQENIKVPENLFRVREQQEHLLKYLSPEWIKSKIVPDILHYLVNNFKIPAEFLRVVGEHNKTYLEDIIEAYLVKYDEIEDTEIIRQPFFIPSFSIAKSKFISIRLNFGNRRAGLQRKILMSSMAIAEIIKGIKSGLLLNAIKTALDETDPLLKSKILEDLCSSRETIEAEGGLEMSESVSAALEEAEKEIESKAEKKTETSEKKKEEIEIEETAPEEVWEEGENDFFGDFSEIRDSIMEMFPEGFGDYILAAELFPKVKEFIEEAKSGFKEVYHLSIADVVMLLKMFEGKEFDEVKAMIRENLTFFGLEDTVVSNEAVLFFLSFLGYLRAQLKILKEITGEIYQALSRIHL